MADTKYMSLCECQDCRNSFVEVGESRKEKIITILKANSSRKPVMAASSDMSYVSSVDRFVTSDKFEQVADEILKMLVG